MTIDPQVAAMIFSRLAANAPQIFQRIKSIYNAGGYTGIPETAPFDGNYIQNTFPNIATAVNNNYDIKAMNEDFLDLDNLTNGYGEDLLEDNLDLNKGTYTDSQGWRNINPTDSTEDLQNLYSELTSNPDFGNSSDALQSALIIELAKRKNRGM